MFGTRERKKERRLAGLWPCGLGKENVSTFFPLLFQQQMYKQMEKVRNQHRAKQRSGASRGREAQEY